MRLKTFVVSAVLSLGLIGCAANDPYRHTKGGAVTGAAVGGVVGAIAGDGKGALIGAAVGALAGGAVGSYMDQQQREFEQALEEEQRKNALEIERLKDETLKLSLNSEVSFDVNRAEIKAAFQPTLDKLGSVLNKYDRTIVHVVGHTDSDGSDAYNMDLSRRRATAVGSYLTSRNVPASRVRTEGRGEREPRSTNATQAGKQLNRRVEIFVKPIVEGQEQRAYESPKYSS